MNAAKHVVNLMGSKRAMDDFNKINELIEQYARRVIEDSFTDGLFRADGFNRMIAELDRDYERLVQNARADLSIG